MLLKLTHEEAVSDEIELELPIYSHLQEDCSNIFIKIKEGFFSKIEVNQFNLGYNISRFDYNHLEIPRKLYSNRTGVKDYEKALKLAKEYLKQF